MAAGPAAATLTMIVAGINTWVTLCFVVISYVVAPYVAYGWSTNELLVCFYVIFLGMLVEHRATLVFGRSTFQPAGYKALISADDGASAAASRADPCLSSRYTAEPLSRGTGSDTEDMSTPLPRELQSSAWLDRLMGRFRSDARGPVSSIFSMQSPSVTSTSSVPRARFSADKVAPPGAAVHEAPYFADKEMEFLEKDLESGRRQPNLQLHLSGESLTSLPFPGSPANTLPGSPDSAGAWRQLRAVKLGGFNNDFLNVLFVERPSPNFRVNGRETYWPASGQYFIYRSASTNTWGIAKAKRFQAIKESKSNGVAHSPEGYELWVEVNEAQSTRKTNWREWDINTNRWVTRPGSGVLSRGKVRPKANVNKSEAEVQTEFEVRHAAVQTVASQAGTKAPGAPGSSPTSPSAASDAAARAASPGPKAAPKAGKKLPGMDPSAASTATASSPRGDAPTLPVPTIIHGTAGKSHHRQADDPRHPKSTVGR